MTKNTNTTKNYQAYYQELLSLLLISTKLSINNTKHTENTKLLTNNTNTTKLMLLILLNHNTNTINTTNTNTY